MISSYQLTRVRPMRRPVGPVCRHDGRRSDPPHTSHSLHDVMRTRRRCLGHRLSRPVPAAHAPAGGRKSRAFQSPLSALGLESSARAGVPPGRAAVASLCLNLSVSESNLKAGTVTSVSAANLGHRPGARCLICVACDARTKIDLLALVGGAGSRRPVSRSHRARGTRGAGFTDFKALQLL